MKNLKSYEEFLKEYYWSPCVGCPEGQVATAYKNPTISTEIG